MIKSIFFISFLDAANEQQRCEGKISLGDTVETFFSSTKFFSRNEYETLWQSSVKKCVFDRNVTALFSDVNIDSDGTGWLWFYTLIPSEDAAEEQYSDTGVFITQRFVPVCTKPENFLTRKFVEYDDGEKGEELAFHFLDLSQPERFFGYLDTNILGISNWFVENDIMESFISS